MLEMLTSFSIDLLLRKDTKFKARKRRDLWARFSMTSKVKVLRFPLDSEKFLNVDEC